MKFIQSEKEKINFIGMKLLLTPEQICLSNEKGGLILQM